MCMNLGQRPVKVNVAGHYAQRGEGNIVGVNSKDNVLPNYELRTFIDVELLAKWSNLKNSGYRPNQGSGGGSNYMAGALLISGGLLADDVTGVGVLDDIAIPLVLVGGYLLDKFMGNPSDWHTTYQHPSQNPIHNTPRGNDPDNFDPNWNTPVKILLGGKLLYEMYDEYNSKFPILQPQPTQRDNTNYFIPRPYRP